jgi:hypothetical protein
MSSFPKVAHSSAPEALSAMMNQASQNGSSAIVAKGFEATRDSLLANLMIGPAGEAFAVAAGTGVTGGTGTIVSTSITRRGGLVFTEILIDLTGLASSTTDLDIIGVGANPAHLGQITTAVNGVIFGGKMECLEVPAGGVTDIDLYAAVEATGVFDGGVAALTETAVITSGGAWTLARALGTAPDGIAANAYLYLCGGAAGTAATYTAGRFLITLVGN